MTWSRIARYFLLATALAGTPSLHGASYIVDQSKSELVVQVFKEGLGAAIAHDHVIRATQFSGQVQFDDENLAGSSVSVEARSGSLRADEPATRKKFNLTSELKESEREQVEANMRAADQLNTAQFPSISFKSTGILKTGANQYSVSGNLTIRGKSQPVKFNATVEVKDGVFTGKGKIKFTQSSFGYQPYSAMFGAIRNQDNAILNITLVARPG